MSLLHTHEILTSVGLGVITEANLTGWPNQTDYVQVEQDLIAMLNRIAGMQGSPVMKAMLSSRNYY